MSGWKPILKLANQYVLAGIVGILPLVFYAGADDPVVWALWALAGAVLYSASVLILRFTVYRRLQEIYEMLLKLKSDRLPDYPISRERDPVRGIRRTILELSGELRAEFAKLRESDILRADFIGDVSHELKTPIFAVQGFIETLLDGALEDPNVNRKFLKRALKNTFRLNDLVVDLLEISKLESGQLKMKFEPFRIYEVILDVAQSLGHRAQRKGLDLDLKIEASGLERAYAVGDAERIHQVVNNLVDNAAKYGSPGETIRVELSEAEGKYWVCVANAGEIEPEHLDRVFERFYRVEKSRARAKGGTGLGLPIVKNLVEAHGEEVSVSSGEGETRFCFSLAKDTKARA